MHIEYICILSYQVVSALPHIKALKQPLYAYKKAAWKVYPIAASFSEDFHIIR
jgi:hypothetical protein